MVRLALNTAEQVLNMVVLEPNKRNKPQHQLPLKLVCTVG